MKMKYTKEMFLQSATGYCMPYSADECEPVPTLGYGEQVHPQTKEKFFHHGMDLTANGATLLAVASGTVTGLGSDPIHEGYVKIRYGNYEVEYGHVTEIYVGFGMEVAAGQQVAKSGNILHIGIRFDGEEIDPADFLAMLYQNCMSSGMVGDGNTGIEVPSAYAKDMDEIASLMSRYLPLYMDELRKGSYRPSEQTEKALQNVFVQSARKNYYFETLPSVTNPLGLSDPVYHLPARFRISSLEISLTIWPSVTLSFFPLGMRVKKKSSLKQPPMTSAT